MISHFSDNLQPGEVVPLYGSVAIAIVSSMKIGDEYRVRDRFRHQFYQTGRMLGSGLTFKRIGRLSDLMVMQRVR